MPLSTLMIAILEQAKEPLLCLNGAGYFSEEEWIQLDLIMNKKYVWTSGPKSRFHNILQADYTANKLNRTGSKNSALSVTDLRGNRIFSSSEETSPGTSIELSLDDVATSTSSTDFAWELSPAMSSPAPINAALREKARPRRTPLVNGLAAGYTLAQVAEAQNNYANLSKSKTQASLTSIQHKNASTLASIIRYNSHQKAQPQPSVSTFGTLSDLDDHEDKSLTLNSRETIVSNNRKDVNSFETSNAAEWDEGPTNQRKISVENEMNLFLIEEKAEKIGLEDQIDKEIISTSIINSSSILPALKDNNMRRKSTATHSTRRGNPRDPTYIPPIPKTKTCWFWAESIGGCRYRPEECLNLHVKPKPGTLPNYPLKDGKPTWGCLADATPQEVPEGKRPLSCWYWATRGSCVHGSGCKFVHGWVIGGVASQPRTTTFHSSDEEEVDAHYNVGPNGRDVGDKAPRQNINMTPTFIASRVHTIGWNTRATT